MQSILEDADIAWLKFLHRKQPIRRTTRNAEAFERLEQLGLVMRTLGGDWHTTPRGLELCHELGAQL